MIEEWGFRPRTIIWSRDSLVQFLNHPSVRSRLKTRKGGRIVPEDIGLSVNEDGTYTLSDVEESP